MKMMRRSKIFLIFVSFVFVYFFVGILTTFAEIKLIEAEGHAIMGDGPTETPAIAKERARNNAKRAAGEKAGVYITSLSVVQNGKLTRDEIHTISANILEVKSDSISTEILGGEAVKYICRITAVVDTDIVTAQLKKSKEKLEDAVKVNEDQIKSETKNETELANLKEQYKKASEPEKEKINQEVKRNEKKFTAIQLNAKGTIRYQLDDLDGAMTFFNQAIATDPQYGAPWSGLGWIHNDHGEYDKGIECFQKSIKLYADFAPAWNGVGYAYSYKAKIENNPDYYNKAIAYYQKAIKLDSTYAAPWNNLGYVYEKQKNYKMAISCYQKAIKLNNKDEVPWSNLGNAYEELGDHDKAIAYYNKALQLNPNYANAWNNLGYIAIRKIDLKNVNKAEIDKIIKYFQKAIELNPDYAEPWNGLGLAHNTKREYKKAVECCRKALQIDPHYADAWNNLGYAYGGLGKYRQSYEAYKKAVEYDPNNEAYKINLKNAEGRI